MEGIYNVVRYSVVHELTNLRSSSVPLAPNAYEFMCAAHSFDRLEAFLLFHIELSFSSIPIAPDVFRPPPTSVRYKRRFVHLWLSDAFRANAFSLTV